MDILELMAALASYRLTVDSTVLRLMRLSKLTFISYIDS